MHDVVNMSSISSRHNNMIRDGQIQIFHPQYWFQYLHLCSLQSAITEKEKNYQQISLLEVTSICYILGLHDILFKHRHPDVRVAIVTLQNLRCRGQINSSNFKGTWHDPPVISSYSVCQSRPRPCTWSGNNIEKWATTWENRKNKDLVPKRKATSIIWNYFDYKKDDIEQTRVLCRQCLGSVTTTG